MHRFMFAALGAMPNVTGLVPVTELMSRGVCGPASRQTSAARGGATGTGGVAGVAGSVSETEAQPATNSAAASTLVARGNVRIEGIVESLPEFR